LLFADGFYDIFGRHFSILCILICVFCFFNCSSTYKTLTK